jgi:hypothetical protein
MYNYRGFCLLTMAAVLLNLAGCGGSSKLSGLVQAQGEVKYKGSPLDGASITFHPVGEGRSASAVSDANGKFIAFTLNNGDGVMPGEYTISVSKNEAIGKQYTKEEIDAIVKSGQDPPVIETKQVLPEKFLSNANSGLKVSIPKGGDKAIVLELID